MSPPEDAITLAVLGERLGNALALLQEVRDAVADPVTGTVATRTTLENHEARIKALEQWHTWMLRTVLGVLIVTAVGVVISVAGALQT